MEAPVAGLRALIVAVGLFLAPGVVPAMGQDFGQVVSPVLIVDRDRLFAESAYGRRIAQLLEAERARQEAETNRIEDELAAEEQALAEQRASLPQAEFRALADAYDAKVQTLREERNAANQRFVQLVESARAAFFGRTTPVLAAIMRERGAVVLLDRRTVLLSADIGITDDAIVRIDSEIGDGRGLDDLPGLEGVSGAGQDAAGAD